MQNVYRHSLTRLVQRTCFVCINRRECDSCEQHRQCRYFSFLPNTCNACFRRKETGGSRRAVYKVFVERDLKLDSDCRNIEVAVRRNEKTIQDLITTDLEDHGYVFIKCVRIIGTGSAVLKECLKGDLL